MYYYAYLLKSISSKTQKTYAGYSVDVEKRLIKHNSNIGAKSTRGYKWKIAYFQEYSCKKKAMREEYLLKKNTKKRNMIKRNILINYENIYSITV